MGLVYKDKKVHISLMVPSVTIRIMAPKGYGFKSLYMCTYVVPLKEDYYNLALYGVNYLYCKLGKPPPYRIKLKSGEHYKNIVLAIDTALGIA